jgi:predicted nucleic acid-binding protein
VIVVDANVVAYLVFRGEWTAEVEALHARDPEWAAPVLLRSELRSVALEHVRASGVEAGAALAALDGARDVLGGREFLVADDRVLALARAPGCSSYDCEYVALAEELGVPLYTFDRALLDAFPELARPPASPG